MLEKYENRLLQIEFKNQIEAAGGYLHCGFEL